MAATFAMDTVAMVTARYWRAGQVVDTQDGGNFSCVVVMNGVILYPENRLVYVSSCQPQIFPQIYHKVAFVLTYLIPLDQLIVGPSPITEFICINDAFIKY